MDAEDTAARHGTGPAGDMWPDIMSDLVKRHGEPHRHWHVWAHPQAMLAGCTEIRARLHDAPAVVDAILFHDAVYDPAAKAGQNERASAALMEARLSSRLDPASIAKRRTFILATAAHSVPAELTGKDAADCAEFLDLDLAILGAGAAEYDAYSRAITREYEPVYGVEAYRLGRIAFLQSMRPRPRIFLTEEAHGQRDEAARSNMEREYATLVARGDPESAPK